MITRWIVAAGLTLRVLAAARALDAASALVRVAGRLRPPGAPRLRLVREEPMPEPIIDDDDDALADWERELLYDDECSHIKADCDETRIPTGKRCCIACVGHYRRENGAAS